MEKVRKKSLRKIYMNLENFSEIPFLDFVFKQWAGFALSS